MDKMILEKAHTAARYSTVMLADVQQQTGLTQLFHRRALTHSL